MASWPSTAHDRASRGTGTMVPDHTTIASPEPAWPRAPTRRAMTLPTAHELAAATTSSTGTTGACAARPTPTVARPAAPTRTPASWPRVGCSRSARLANTSVKRTWDCSTRGVRPAGMPACIARYTSPNWPALMNSPIRATSRQEAPGRGTKNTAGRHTKRKRTATNSSGGTPPARGRWPRSSPPRSRRRGWRGRRHGRSPAQADRRHTKVPAKDHELEDVASLHD